MTETLLTGEELDGFIHDMQEWMVIACIDPRRFEAKRIARQLLASMQEAERLRASVLLAARWFHLNWESNDPPSKEDVGGMAAAMKQALQKGSL